MIKNNTINWCLFLLWSTITVTLIYHHSFWGDEVINLIFGIGADSQYGMHGNGHPAVWFLLLKGLYLVFHQVWVLPLASFLVAAVAVWLFIFKAPFGLLFKILFLLSNFALYEYVVMARNYGISMLVMFVLAIVLSQERLKKKWTGPCLFVLCNTNIHSAILAVAYVFGSLVKAVKSREINNRDKKVEIAGASFFTALGLIVCFFTVFPTFDTVASKQAQSFFQWKNFTTLLVLPSTFRDVTYEEYALEKPVGKIAEIDDIYKDKQNTGVEKYLVDDKNCLNEYLGKEHAKVCDEKKIKKSDIIKVKVWNKSLSALSFILIALSFLALYGDLDLFASAVFGFFCLDFFFSFIYWGAYRHQALWLVFMVSLLWVSRNNNKAFSVNITKIRRLGYNAFTVIIALQIWPAASHAYNELFATPNSNAKLFSKLLKGDDDLKNSAIISTNDFLIEALHYYVVNPTFIMSQKQFGIVFPFAISDASTYNFDNVLDSANYIAFCNHVPVLILLSDARDTEHRIAPDKITEETLYRYEYLNFYINTQQVDRLRSQAHKIATFAPSVNEFGFSVYKLSPQDAQPQTSCPSQYIFDRTKFDLEHIH